MSERRDKLQIIYDVLNSIRSKNAGKIKPTHLLYKSNLSHVRMKKYIEDLMVQGLIEEIFEKKQKMYSLTPKGFEFISEFSKIKEFTDSFGI